MNTEKLLLACCCFLSLLLFNTCNCSANNPPCAPSSCGNIHNITSPFRLKSDPSGCGDTNYELSCENNVTVLHRYFEKKFIVKAISYSNYTIRVADPGVDINNCSSLPRFTLPFYLDPYHSLGRIAFAIKVIKCVEPVHSDRYLDANSCFQQQKTSSREFYWYAYVGRMSGFDLRDGCIVEAKTVMIDSNISMLSFTEIHRRMAFGFELYFSDFYCSAFCGSREYNDCYFDDINGNIACYFGSDEDGFILVIHKIYYFASELLDAFGDLWSYLSAFIHSGGGSQEIRDQIRIDIEGSSPVIYWVSHASAALVVALVGVRNLCGAPFVIVFIIYKWRRRHLSGYHAVEEFLQGQNNFIMPIRYSYSDIKKITGGFSEMLGKGGFGSVYKGKLRSGQFAAIKILETSKAKGQDFINEVATIGRIHHANIVRLIGYCSQGSKHALLYEFMSNKSLDAHIFSREESSAISWEKLYEISLGVARGIEYLHRGCDIQILHFDIKPHNILLDDNFSPKLSDFGLAKFYSKNDSIASLTAARGTIGYMAPELFYKNIGRVSYKADVYSFGMLLLEMAGKRKNLKVPTEDPSAENLSQVYYPFWVYDKLADGNLEIEDATDEENKIVRKMIIAGLWCIQMQPSNRPSMDEVVKMLEGNLENLQLPPRPVLFPIQSTEKDEEESSVSVSSSTTCKTDEGGSS